MGRRITAIGGNEAAARLAGVTTIVIVARQDAAQAVMGQGIELPVIAAVILGGTSLCGGRSLAMGSLMGALIPASLENGLVVIGLSAFVRQVLPGPVFVTIAAFRAIRFRQGQVTR